MTHAQKSTSGLLTNILKRGLKEDLQPRTYAKYERSILKTVVGVAFWKNDDEDEEWRHHPDYDDDCYVKQFRPTVRIYIANIEFVSLILFEI